MGKSQTAASYFYFFVQENLYFIRKHIWKNLHLQNLQNLQLTYKLHVLYRFFTWQVIGNVVTPMPIQIFISFVDATLRSKILDNRLGILRQILITMDYFFYLYITDIYLQFSGENGLIYTTDIYLTLSLADFSNKIIY